MTKVRVGVLRGGRGNEYAVSLKTGDSVLRALSLAEYETRDILITPDNMWHMNGVPTTPEKVSRSVDLVWNALHGEFGEDGKVQKILDAFGVPYTGSTAIPSALGMHKGMAKRVFAAAGLQTPRGVVVARGEEIEDVVQRVHAVVRAPYIVKPALGGSSVGLSLARDERELVVAVEYALSFGAQAVVEEYIAGREITIGVIDAPHGEGSYVTPPLEVFPPDDMLFSYDLKYSGADHVVRPARLHERDRAAIEEVALRAHHALNVRDYARYDFILTHDGPYLLEVNTLPALAQGTLFPKSLAIQGLLMPEFTGYIAELALQRK